MKNQEKRTCHHVDFCCSSEIQSEKKSPTTTTTKTNKKTKTETKKQNKTKQNKQEKPKDRQVLGSCQRTNKKNSGA